jgi:signal transduction histidine kinase
MITDPNPAPQYNLETRSPGDEISRQSSLIAEMNLLGIISEHNADFVGVLNRNRQFVFLNDVYFAASGSVPELLGKRPGEIFGCVHSNDHQAGCGAGPACRFCDAVGAVTEALLTKNRVNREGRILISRDGKDNSLDIFIHAVPVEVENEEFIILHIRDISSKKRMEILERTFYHDILNSMTTISSIVQLSTIESPDIPHADRLLCRSLRDAIEQIQYQRLLKDVEEGRSVPEMQRIELYEELEPLIESVNNEIFLNGRLLEVQPGERGSYIEGYPVILRRIVLNMLKNAAEASNPGETIGLQIGCSDTDVFIRVSNPQLMSSRIQAGIFQHSFSTKGQGRGIGTYSMKMLSQRLLNGDVSFTSKDGKGTVFQLQIPRN